MLPAITDDPFPRWSKTTGSGTVPVSIVGVIGIQEHGFSLPSYTQPHVCVARMVTVLSDSETPITDPRKLYDGSVAPAGRQQAHRARIRNMMKSVRFWIIRSSPPDWAG